LLWRWAKRRHPHKGQWWISTNYWHRKGNRNWVFCTEDKELLRVDHIPIVRHTKVRMDANPYFDTQYFIDRKFQQGMKRLSGRFKQVWKNQRGCCYHCGLPMDISDEREIFFKVPKAMGGKDEVRNMAYVHRHCQQIFLERRAKA
jgi:RNA-directed DNA polymerase